MAYSTVFVVTIAFTVLLLAGPSSAQPTYEHLRVYPKVTTEGTRPLYFGLMELLSYQDDSTAGTIELGSVAVPGIEVALDQINANTSSMLPGYTLHYILSDSKVSSGSLCLTSGRGKR